MVTYSSEKIWNQQLLLSSDIFQVKTSLKKLFCNSTEQNGDSTLRVDTAGHFEGTLGQKVPYLVIGDTRLLLNPLCYGRPVVVHGTITEE